MTTLHAAALAVAAVVTVAAAQPPAPGASGSGIRTLERGSQSNVDSTREAIAKTAAEFTALWKTHNYDKPAPRVDFSREMVVAVFMGSRPTAGFSVEIVSAADRDGELVVTYREKKPPAGAMTAQVLTAPYHIAAIPKSAKPVKFEKG